MYLSTPRRTPHEDAPLGVVQDAAVREGQARLVVHPGGDEVAPQGAVGGRPLALPDVYECPDVAAVLDKTLLRASERSPGHRAAASLALNSTQSTEGGGGGLWGGRHPAGPRESR